MRAMQKPVRPAAPKESPAGVSSRSEETGEAEGRQRAEEKVPGSRAHGPQQRSRCCVLPPTRATRQSPPGQRRRGVSPKQVSAAAPEHSFRPRPEGDKLPLAPVTAVNPGNEQGRNLVPTSTRRMNSGRQESPWRGAGGPAMFPPAGWLYPEEAWLDNYHPVGQEGSFASRPLQANTFPKRPLGRGSWCRTVKVPLGPSAPFPAEDIEPMDPTELVHVTRAQSFPKFCNPNGFRWVERHPKGESLGTEDTRRSITETIRTPTQPDCRAPSSHAG